VYQGKGRIANDPEELCGLASLQMSTTIRIIKGPTMHQVPSSWERMLSKRTEWFLFALYIGTATCGDDTVPQFKDDHPV